MDVNVTVQAVESAAEDAASAMEVADGAANGSTCVRQWRDWRVVPNPSTDAFLATMASWDGVMMLTWRRAVGSASSVEGG